MTAKPAMLAPAAAKQTAQINLRTSRRVKDVIEQAAALKGCSLSSFIFDICIAEAQRLASAEKSKPEKTSQYPTK